MTEITKDRDFKTNVNIESQTINYAKNPEKFKEDLEKAKNEIEDIGNVVKNTLNPPGKDKRNIFENLRAQRWTTSFYNVTGSRMEELSRQFKAGEIDENQLKEAVRELAKGYGKDIGIDFEVVYLDKDTMPKDSEGSTGSAYKSENGKILIPIDVEKIKKTGNLFGTITEEISHGKDALEGRQDKKVAEDNSNDEEGLESLGRPANEYVKNKLGEDNNSKIKLSTDGIDLTNVNVGEKIGDYLPKHEIDAAGGVDKVLTPTTNEEIFKVVRLKSNQEVAVEFYQGVTNKSLWSGIYDFTPIAGDGKGFIEGLTGKDMITGEKLSMFQRIIGGIPLIHQVGKSLTLINKPIKKGADYVVNYFISDASKGISKLDNINDTTKLANVAEGVGDSSNITKSVAKEIKIADDTADIAKASKNVEKISDVSKEYQNLINYEKKQELVRIKKDVKEIIKEQASTKAEVLDKFTPEELSKFKKNLGSANLALDEKTGAVIGPKGGTGEIIGKTSNGDKVIKMYGNQYYKITEKGKVKIAAEDVIKFKNPVTDTDGNNLIFGGIKKIEDTPAKKDMFESTKNKIDNIARALTGKSKTQRQLENLEVDVKVRES